MFWNLVARLVFVVYTTTALVAAVMANDGVAALEGAYCQHLLERAGAAPVSFQALPCGHTHPRLAAKVQRYMLGYAPQWQRWHGRRARPAWVEIVSGGCTMYSHVYRACAPHGPPVTM